jgi:hypothetical protein
MDKSLTLVKLLLVTGTVKASNFRFRPHGDVEKMNL